MEWQFVLISDIVLRHTRLGSLGSFSSLGSLMKSWGLGA